MKIGIVTYWKSSNNYGEQLQNYALQEYLRRLGHEPFLIRYDYEKDTIYGSKPLYIRLLRACNPKRLYRYFKSRKDNSDRAKDAANHPRGFEMFRDEHLSMSRVYESIDDLQNDPPKAQIYITGSDQVWNSFGGKLSEMEHRLRAFMLGFGPDNVLRISYAASWGRSSLPADEEQVVSPLISALDAVSVREESGIDLCRSLGRHDAIVAPDPVILFNADDYRKLYGVKSSVKPSGKYLFLYYLNHDSEFDKKAVFDWAKNEGLEIVYVTDDWHDDYKRSFPTVWEWIDLIDNAECVVTNSFHCSLLSLIFEKKFGVIRRFGEHAGMNTRIDHLFELCGIEPRYIDSSDFEILKREADILSRLDISSLNTPEKVIETAIRHSNSAAV